MSIRVYVCIWHTTTHKNNAKTCLHLKNIHISPTYMVFPHQTISYHSRRTQELVECEVENNGIRRKERKKNVVIRFS